VLNVWPASFAQAETSSRVMIVATPVIALLSRWLVIHKRLVPLTRGDQQQLFVSCVCNCGIAVVLAAYFEREEADAAYASDPSQYIVLALLVLQLLHQCGWQSLHPAGAKITVKSCGGHFLVMFTLCSKREACHAGLSLPTSEIGR
jgi:hypothetical protein